MNKIAELTTQLPQHVKINGELYWLEKINTQNYASILRGGASEIDPTLVFTFRKVELVDREK